MTSVALEYDTPKSTVHDIVKSKEKLKSLSQRNRGWLIVHRANLEDLDKAVYLWFVQQCCKGTPISGTLLMGKALQLHPLLYPKAEPGLFKAGTGWLKRFKERHGIRALSV